MTSSTSVTVIDTACDVLLVPSEALTVMLYTRSPPMSEGLSKSGAVLKVIAPVVSLMLNRPASLPDRL